MSSSWAVPAFGSPSINSSLAPFKCRPFPTHGVESVYLLSDPVLYDSGGVKLQQAFPGQTVDKPQNSLLATLWADAILLFCIVDDFLQPEHKPPCWDFLLRVQFTSQSNENKTDGKKPSMILKLWIASTIRFFLFSRRYVSWDLWRKKRGGEKWSTLTFWWGKSKQTTIRRHHLRLEKAVDLNDLGVRRVIRGMHSLALRQRAGRNWVGLFLFFHWRFFWCKKRNPKLTWRKMLAKKKPKPKQQQKL